MAPSKKGKRRKGKGKKGKKGKKKAVVPEPLPLHELTELYKKIDILVRQLLDARVIARKKRKEAELLDTELENAKRDDAVYREHLQNSLDEVEESIENMKARIQKERDSIQAEADRINAEYDKRLLLTLARIEELEKQLEEYQNELKGMQALIDEMARTLAEIESLMDEYNRLQIEVLIKSIFLRNQYLSKRAELFNYLQLQLKILISKIREYIMPYLWEHMHKLQMKNRCLRWDLLQIDEKNTRLLRARDCLVKKVEQLDTEKQYFGTSWIFVKLHQMRMRRQEENLRWKRRLKDIFKTRNITQHLNLKAKTTAERAPTMVEIDYKEFLNKRLEANTQAKEREARLQKRQERHERKLQEEKKQKEILRRKANFKEHLRKVRGEVDLKSSSGTVKSAEMERKSVVKWKDLSIDEFSVIGEQSMMSMMDVNRLRSNSRVEEDKRKESMVSVNEEEETNRSQTELQVKSVTSMKAIRENSLPKVLEETEEGESEGENEGGDGSGDE